MENTENNNVVSIETKNKKVKKDHSKVKAVVKDIGFMLLGAATTIGLAALLGGKDGNSAE